jgi:spore maturation protein SpmA
MRADAGAAMPADVIACVWLTSMAAALIGVVLIKIMARRI